MRYFRYSCVGTGTADNKTVKKIKAQLAMGPLTISITLLPERPNIKVSKKDYMQHFQWIANMIKRDDVKTPKTIIFCFSLTDVANVVGSLLELLGEALYEPDRPPHPSKRLVGIYPAHTHAKYKDRVLSSFKSVTGTIRVVIATTALGMGVNFPDVKFIVHAGPERSLVD